MFSARLLALISLGFSTTLFAAPTDWVDLAKLDFSIRQSGVGKCALRRVVAEGLSAVAANYRLSGLGLKVTGCYRPKSSAQRPCGDHSRGDAVDLSVVDRLGVAQTNYRRLVSEMRRAGFTPDSASKTPNVHHFVFSTGARPEGEDVPLSSIK